VAALQFDVPEEGEVLAVGLAHFPVVEVVGNPLAVLDQGCMGLQEKQRAG
jgi:hypothetical protein